LMNESRRLKLSGVRLKEGAGLMGDSIVNRKLIRQR
jgi:hypothetical protein